MGLDMFLSKMKKVKNYDFNSLIELDTKIQTDLEGFKKTNDYLYLKDYIKERGKDYKYFSMKENIGYWRKANQIHNWFVNTVQNGCDDCEYYEVTKEQILHLKKLCNKLINKIKITDGRFCTGHTYDKDYNAIPVYRTGKVIKNEKLCKRILPTKEGFFFGSTSYTKYYVEDLRHTVEVINKVLKNVDFETEYLIYTSSW